MPNARAPLVVILVYDGLCTFEFGCAFEVFGLKRPEMGAKWYRCKTAAVEKGTLRGAGGIRIDADGGLALLRQADTIVIPGWRAPDAVVPASLITALRGAHARGCRLVAICAGAFVLAQSGLLSRRRATTHWHHVGKLAANFPDVAVEPQALYVDGGDILTSAGSAAGLDLCVHVVRKDFGSRAANSVARRLVIAAHREGGQAQFIERPVPPPSGARLSGLLDTIRGKLREPWTIQRMARVAHISARTLHRQVRDATGLAPGEWLRQERLSHARELLEATKHSIDRIAALTGLGTAANLRQHFRSVFHTSPSAYRATFYAEQDCKKRVAACSTSVRRGQHRTG